MVEGINIVDRVDIQVTHLFLLLFFFLSSFFLVFFLQIFSFATFSQQTIK